MDAKTGVPLKFTLTPASGGAAVVDAGFTKVDFAEPAASTFDFTPPKGAKVTEGDGSRRGKAPEDCQGLPRGSEGARDAQGGGIDGLKIIGEGWTPSPSSTPAARACRRARRPAATTSPGFLDVLGDQVTGKFGSGTVFSTRLVNALITDDGKVYAGAVTKDALVKAANAAQ